MENERSNITSDLVKRLREVGGMSDDGATRWYINPDGPEAADRIEKLESELVQAFNHMMNDTNLFDEASDRIEKLEAALREIAALGYWDGDSAISIASKALEGKDD